MDCALSAGWMFGVVCAAAFVGFMVGVLTACLMVASREN